MASARLFGVVGGPGSRLELSERGRLILAGEEPGASQARRDAFLAVPLFAAVHDAVVPNGGGLPDDDPGSRRRFGRVWSRRGDRSPGMEGVAVADGGLWLEEEPDGPSARTSPWRRGAAVGAAVAVLMVAAVPIALVLAGPARGPAAARSANPPARPDHGPPEHAVLSALSATTDTGSFDFSYSIRSSPASGTPSTTPTTECQQLRVPVPTGATSPGAGTNGGGAVVPSVATATAVGPATASGSGPTDTVGGTLPPGMTWKFERVCTGAAVPSDPVVQGGGVINTNPLAMVASADIGGGLDVTVRVDQASVYEEGSNDTGLAPQSSDTPGGTDLPQFAAITEGTLGSREGAVAMMGMASPTGYLDLIAPAITAAAQTGTGTVDGVAVTDYSVTNDLSQLAGAAGTSAAESQTISAALGLLDAQGYTSNDVVVSIDASGFIRQVRSTDAFSDGGSVTLEATFSDFGCAGTILMPGQTGSGVPPAGCTPPSGAPASSTTSTTALPTADAVPTTTGPSTSTTNPSGPTPTSSSSPSTTSTTLAGATGTASSSTTTPSASTPPSSG